MENTVDSKSFLVYIPPSEYVSDLLKEVNQKLRDRHPSNTYLPLYQGKWHSHLMLYLSPMPVKNQGRIIEKVKAISKKIILFNIELSELEMAESNYLYIGVNKEAKVILENIHNNLVEALYPHRDTTIKEKYLQKWDSFSEEEKNRIKTTGLPYIYVPHTTLGVFENKKELEQAYNEAQEFNLTGKSFTADRIEILTSVGSDYRDKEIVLSEKFLT
jgi:2'-5' RNA ligase